jgi:hypothetical protein
MSEEAASAAGAVSADQDRAAVAMFIGDLGQRLIDHRGVVGGIVRGRVAGPQHPGQRLSGVVQPSQHWVVAIAVLVGCGRPFLLGVAGHQRGVEVDHQTRLDPTTTHHRRQATPRLLTQQPGPLPSGRPSPFQLSQGGLVDRVEDPPRGRRRGHAAKQAGLVPQHRQIGDRLPTVGDHHRQIGQHPARPVRRTSKPPGGGHRIKRLDQTRSGRHVRQQPSPDMGDDTLPVRRHHNLRQTRDSLHLRSAFPVDRL